jgi:photosystem II stability/assembly factor-like uncharacterized protein
MPYALAPIPEQSQGLVVGLRGGRVLLTENAGESWTQLTTQLPDLVDLAATPG